MKTVKPLTPDQVVDLVLEVLDDTNEPEMEGACCGSCVFQGVPYVWFRMFFGLQHKQPIIIPVTAGRRKTIGIIKAAIRKAKGDLQPNHIIGK